MRLSSSQIAPLVVGSRPARQLSAVDLPQPDGPSRAMNSPRLMVERHVLQRREAAEGAADIVEPQLAKGLAGKAPCSLLHIGFDVFQSVSQNFLPDGEGAERSEEG